MPLKCHCKNNTPVRIANDEKGGERYECYYCKSTWRYIEVHNTLCKFCDDHGINLKNKIKDKVKCSMCGTEHNTSNYAIKIVLVFW
jgi:formate dehydrogenase maturation protein FdhE